MKKIYSNEEIARRYYQITVTERNKELGIDEEDENKENSIEDFIKFLEITRGKEEEMTETELDDYIEKLENKLEYISIEEQIEFEKIEKENPERILILKI